MIKKPISLIKEYFLGSVLREEPNVLARTNYTIIFTISLSVVLLLIPLTFIFLSCTVAEPLQIFGVLLGIAFNLGILFFLKMKGSVAYASIAIILMSTFFLSFELIVYEQIGLILGLHLAVNLIYSVHMLTKRLLIISIIVHSFALSFNWANSSFGWIIVDQLAELEDFVLVLITGIIMFIIITILAFYNDAQVKMSKELTDSLVLVKSAKAAAEEMNELKTRFLANMSHEIRTPLNGILGINELLRKYSLDDEMKEFLDIQSKSGARLLNTIDGILSLSKIETNQAFFKLKIMSALDIVEEVVNSQIVLSDKQNITLSIHNKASNLQINVDESLVYQALTNLINNAIKFTHPGGTVIVKLYNTDSKYLIIDVIDTGIGISKEFLPIVFEPFERDTKHHSSKHTGTGLGLSITQKFIELMGGNISVASQLRKGTTFSVKLPSYNPS